MKHLGIAVSIAAAWMIGCSRDERLADFAEHVTREQASYNERMAESTQSLAEGSKQLVAADAQARNDLIDLQHHLRSDQVQIAEQLSTLEGERRELAEETLPSI